MSRTDNRSYHAFRAEDELRLAEQSSDPAVASIHRELAALHKRQMMALVEHRGDLPRGPGPQSVAPAR